MPAAAEISGLQLAEVCAWAAQLADHNGADPRAVELVRRAIELTPDESWQQVALLYVRLGEYLHGTAEDRAALGALKRAVALTREHPGSSEWPYTLSSLAGGLMVEWRFTASLPLAREALDQARAVGAREAEVRALTVLGVALVHCGHADDGITIADEALALAEQNGDLVGLERAYVNLTDSLTIVGRHRTAARLAATGTAAMRRNGVVSALLTANHVEALLALGEWDEGDRISASALRAATASFPYMIPLLRADLEIGRGDFDSARAHLNFARETMRADHGFGIFEASVAELALWERRWSDAHQLLQEARARAGSDETALLRVWFCAKALRAQAELAALARDRHDSGAARRWTVRMQDVIADARATAAIASRVTPNAEGWLALAESEYSRAGGETDPDLWEIAAVAWDRLERPPIAAYCRWREAEALLGAGAAHSDAALPLRAAYAVATRMSAAPLARELEALARRARVDPRAPEQPQPTDPDLAGVLGLTPREAEVLRLVAQGCTNREIARTLVISDKTTEVHVTHILRKLARRADPVAGRGDRPSVGPPAPAHGWRPNRRTVTWSALCGCSINDSPGRTSTWVAVPSTPTAPPYATTRGAQNPSAERRPVRDRLPVADGNTPDDLTHVPTWDALHALVGQPGFLYVADSKPCSKQAMGHIHSHGGRFVTIVPRGRREDTWFRDWAQTHAPAWAEARRAHGARQGDPDRIWRTFQAPAPSVDGYRLIWVHSSSKAARDAGARAARIEAGLAAIDAVQARLARPKSRIKTTVAAQQAATTALQSAGATRWVGFTRSGCTPAAKAPATRWPEPPGPGHEGVAEVVHAGLVSDPMLTGTGAAPHNAAKDASLRSRSGLSRR